MKFNDNTKVSLMLIQSYALIYVFQIFEYALHAYYHIRAIEHSRNEDSDTGLIWYTRV